MSSILRSRLVPNFSLLKFRISKLILRLIGAFMLVIVISALVIYFLTFQATQNAFRLYTTQNSQLWADRLAPDFANFYIQSGSWQGVESFVQASTQAGTADLTDMMAGMAAGRGAGRGQGRAAMGTAGGMGWMGGMSQRLILADAQGRVIADSDAAESLIGSRLSETELASGSPVMVNGQVVGTLIVARPTCKLP